mgnify:CR=1 FL=1|jgi:hypothetical protein
MEFMKKEGSELEGVRKFPKYDSNPYVEKLSIPKKNKTVAVSVRGLPLFDTATGEVAETAFMAIREQVDKEQFVKLFKSQIQSMFNLNAQGLRVFGYLLNVTRISEDIIYFNIEDCKKFTGYKSINSINLGIANLLKHSFIARATGVNLLYLNPNIFFNGDRMVVVKEYIIKGSKAEKAILEKEEKLLPGLESEMASPTANGD